MGNYDETLNLYKKLQTEGVTHVETAQAAPSYGGVNVGYDIDALDEAVFGKYEADEGVGSNNGNELLLKTMKEIENGSLSEDNRKRIEENIQNSKIPKAILQDMLSNPCIMTSVDGDDVDEFIQKNIRGGSGVQASMKINEKLEKSDEKRREEASKRIPVQQQTVIGEAIDYDRIAAIVEQIVDKKLKQVSMLTENASRQPMGQLKAMQMKDNSSFLMVDTDDNVYECKLSYKGKNKKKQR